jgi:L-threonylcarbamoyladenylate synthase
MEVISSLTSDWSRIAGFKLKLGHLVAFPTETVYGLGADAQNERAVSRIYEVKARPRNHPVIIHFSSTQYLDKWVINVPEYAKKLANFFWPGPMTLILPRSKIAKDYITGGQDSVGVRIPDNKIALELLKVFEDLGGFGVAAPSANRFGQVSPTSASDVSEEIGDYLKESDLIVNGGPCSLGLESTILDCRSKSPIILRPGAIEKEKIEEVSGKRVLVDFSTNSIRTSGQFKSHYAPKTLVYLDGVPQVGDGYIALDHYKTPKGSVRLASPSDNLQFANQLYSALRLADRYRLSRVFVEVPKDGPLSAAIIDRLSKMTTINIS